MNHPKTDRICAACKHLVGKRHYSDTADNWRCHAPQNVVTTSQDLVTGATVYHTRFEDCYACRSDDAGCGSLGQWYEEYKQEMYYEKPRVVGGTKKTAEDLLDELDKL